MIWAIETRGINCRRRTSPLISTEMRKRSRSGRLEAVKPCGSVAIRTVNAVSIVTIYNILAAVTCPRRFNTATTTAKITRVPMGIALRGTLITMGKDSITVMGIKNSMTPRRRARRKRSWSWMWPLKFLGSGLVSRSQLSAMRLHNPCGCWGLLGLFGCSGSCWGLAGLFDCSGN